MKVLDGKHHNFTGPEVQFMDAQANALTYSLGQVTTSNQKYANSNPAFNVVAF
jgi:hypothetical protein